MTCRNKEGGAMDVDGPQTPNGHGSQLKENGLTLHPVSSQEEGEGLPYAPVDWPNPGDTWGWRVGRRTTISGFYVDRYLYLPSRFQKSRRGRDGFASKLSIKQYILDKFPGADVEAFFASFSWKIPSKQAFFIKDHHDTSSCMLSEEISEPSFSNCQNGAPACKVGNRLCPSLTEEEKVSSIATTMFCDICCSEPSFCRDCCCILCCKPLDLSFEGYSLFRCSAVVNNGLICGHAAHLLCALRSYLAGTVGGSTIALEAEYFCRRCDSRTGLVEHVTKIFKICESVESRDDIKKMLDLVICLVRGSQKKHAKRLLNRAQLVLQKFECGNAVTDIWVLEDDVSTVKIAEAEDKTRESTQQTHSRNQSEYQKISDEVNQVLEELKGSQQYEYKIAQKKLLAQRDLLFNLYQQLDTDTLAHKAETEEKIKRETKKLRNMKKVGKGFGRLPKDILQEYFDLDMKD